MQPTGKDSPGTPPPEPADIQAASAQQKTVIGPVELASDFEQSTDHSQGHVTGSTPPAEPGMGVARHNESGPAFWQRQGRRDEARGVLTAIYDVYTEGFTTPDLVDARALLDALA